MAEEPAEVMMEVVSTSGRRVPVSTNLVRTCSQAFAAEDVYATDLLDLQLTVMARNSLVHVCEAPAHSLTCVQDMLRRARVRSTPISPKGHRVVAGSLMFVICGHTMLVYDLRDPSVPRLVTLRFRFELHEVAAKVRNYPDDNEYEIVVVERKSHSYGVFHSVLHSFAFNKTSPKTHLRAKRYNVPYDIGTLKHGTDGLYGTFETQVIRIQLPDGTCHPVISSDMTFCDILPCANGVLCLGEREDADFHCTTQLQFFPSDPEPSPTPHILWEGEEPEGDVCVALLPSLRGVIVAVNGRLTVLVSRAVRDQDVSMSSLRAAWIQTAAQAASFWTPELLQSPHKRLRDNDGGGGSAGAGGEREGGSTHP